MARDPCRRDVLVTRPRRYDAEDGSSSAGKAEHKDSPGPCGMTTATINPQADVNDRVQEEPWQTFRGG